MSEQLKNLMLCDITRIHEINYNTQMSMIPRIDSHCAPRNGLSDFHCLILICTEAGNIGELLCATSKWFIYKPYDSILFITACQPRSMHMLPNNMEICRKQASSLMMGSLRITLESPHRLVQVVHCCSVLDTASYGALRIAERPYQNRHPRL